MKHVTHVRTDWRRRHEGSRHKGERDNVRPRDSKDRATDAESTNEARASVATALRSSADGNDSRVSRVVAMVMSPAAPLAMVEASSSGTREEDVVTAVDGAREALTEEQHAALARRIRLAMEHPGLDQTLLLGTPLPPAALPPAASPAPVQPSSFIAPPPNPSTVPPVSGERAPISFKKTMLLGLPRLPTEASPASPAAPSSVASVRASVVRDVGPPRTPPPRRSRRAGAVPLPDATALAGELDAELEPPDHEAFELDHPIVSPELAPRSVHRQAWPGLAPARLAAPTPLVPRAELILPPPPGPRDLEPSPATGREAPSSWLDRFERSELSGAAPDGSSHRGSAWDRRAGAASVTPPLAELPSTDPFAGFSAPPPSLARRWARVMVVALAVVGAFALAALALRWLTHATW